jgi:hypothetical protein
LAKGILPVVLDRDATVVPPEAMITTNGWVSPRLWASRPVLPVKFEEGRWIAPGKKPRDASVAE